MCLPLEGSFCELLCWLAGVFPGCFQVTLIREYAQGPNALMYCLPTGGLDPHRHADMAECAARELSEEVRRSLDSCITWSRACPVP